MLTEIWWIIFAMAFVTYPMRLVPIVLLSRVRIPPQIFLAMQFLPFCIMVSMLVIDITSDPATAVWRLLMLIPVALISWASGNIGLGVLVGVAGYSALFAFQ